MSYFPTFISTVRTDAGGLNITGSSVNNGLPGVVAMGLFSFWIVTPSLLDLSQITFLNYEQGKPFYISVHGNLIDVQINDRFNVGAEYQFVPPAGSFSGTIVHVLISWASGNAIQCAVNGTLLTPSSVSGSVAAQDNDTPTNAMLFELNSGVHSGNQPCYGDVYFAVPTRFYDLRIAGNIQRFIDANGNPVDLGPHGGNPLNGTRPAYFLKVRDGAPVLDFLTNFGSAKSVTIDHPTDMQFCGGGPPRGHAMFPGVPSKDFDPPAFDVVGMVTATTGGPYWVERSTKSFDVADPITSAWFLDGAITPTYVKNITTGVKLYGLWHLRGQTNITAFLAGLDCGDHTVAADGTMTVNYGTDPDALFTHSYYVAHPTAVVGYKYTSQGQILRPGTKEEAGAMNGPPLAKARRAHMLGANVVNAVGVSFGTDFTTAKAAQFSTKGGTPYTKAQMYTDIYWDTLDDTYSFDSMLCWQVIRPYPCTIASIGSFLSTQDR